VTAIDPPAEREPGRRYLVLGTGEGTSAWEVGWDGFLGAFFAQEVRLSADESVVETGTKVFDPVAFESLGQRIGRQLPADVARELYEDAVAFPAGFEPSAIASEWAGSLYRQLGIAPRWTLPAGPVVELIDEHLADWGGDDRLRVALSMGFAPELARGLVDGSVRVLSVSQIAEVCEVLYCSPFDMWDTDLARSVLHVYGPELWPRHIQPLRDVPRLRLVPGLGDASEGLAAESDAETTGAAPDPAAEDRALVTAYRDGGLIAITSTGRPVELWEVAAGRAEIHAYHQVFQQAGTPRITGHFEPALRSPTDWAGYPGLAEHAAAVRRDLETPFDTDVELVRFTWSSASETWLVWNRGTESWEPWTDPRGRYPGLAEDVLDRGPFATPEERLSELDGPSVELHARDAAADPGPVAPSPVAPSFAAGSDVIATGYGRTAILAVDPTGEVNVVSASSAATPDAEYHYAFVQVTRPSTYLLFAAEHASAGDGVDPLLAGVASHRVNDIDRLGPGTTDRIDMVRISPTDAGAFHPGPEAWLGWQPEARSWELWDDPRRHFPGPPNQVLDPGSYDPPEDWNAAMEKTAIDTHDLRRLEALGIPADTFEPDLSDLEL
jgi:hypothetical protein